MDFDNSAVLALSWEAFQLELFQVERWMIESSNEDKLEYMHGFAFPQPGESVTQT